jgi:phosphoadenosine phosphosulfate reductase
MSAPHAPLTEAEIRAEARALEDRSAEEVLAWATRRFGDGVALASSFGAEDVVLIDMLCKQTPAPRVFCLDTGRLPQATHDVIAAIRSRYTISVETFFPETTAVEEMVRLRGPNLFYESVADRERCCRVRKLEPLRRALGGLRAWITGLRREQAQTRAYTEKLELDEDHGGLCKINPLVTWTTDDVWRYIRAHDVPYNRLHDAGYPSIGCEPCTRAVREGEDLRAGRWWWEQPEHRECGLHVHGRGKGPP